MSDVPEKAMFRLAFRVEGEWWRCYLAPHETMDGATLMGEIDFGLVQHPETKREFIELMQRALARGGAIVDGEIVSAPEHERSGRG